MSCTTLTSWQRHTPQAVHPGRQTMPWPNITSGRATGRRRTNIRSGAVSTSTGSARSRSFRLATGWHSLPTRCTTTTRPLRLPWHRQGAYARMCLPTSTSCRLTSAPSFLIHTATRAYASTTCCRAAPQSLPPMFTMLPCLTRACCCTRGRDCAAPSCALATRRLLPSSTHSTC